MNLFFREALPSDVAKVVALLRDDELGAARETANMPSYFKAFYEMRSDPNNLLIVGDLGGQLVATYHLTIIAGLTLAASKRAQLEGVRVASDLRGQGIGAALIADAEQRAALQGCKLMQLTMNSSREDADRFYQTQGFVPSHTGFKRIIEE